MRQIFSITEESRENKQGMIISKHKIINILGIKCKFKINITEDYKNLFKLYKKVLKQNTRLSQDLNNFKYSLGYVNAKKFLDKEHNKELEQQLQILYKDLDNLAVEHLNQIIRRSEKVLEYKRLFGDIPLARLVYDEEEMKDINAALKLASEIKFCDTYYQWKNYKLPIGFFEPSVFLGKHGIEALQNKNRINNGVIIDAGGYIGDSILIFREEFPDNQIISFEPDKTNFELLNKTIQLNNIQNVVCENLALGESDTIVHTVCKKAHYGVQISPTGNTEVKLVTLDSYVKSKNITISLIKTDLEGYEINFIKGAKRTIQEQKPTLLISIYHNKQDFFTIKSMLEEIATEAGFKYRFDFFCGAYPRNSLVDCLLLCEPIE